MLLCELQGIRKMYSPSLKPMLKCKYRLTEMGIFLEFISNLLWLPFLYNVYSLTDLLRVLLPKFGFALHTEKTSPRLSQEGLLVLKKNEWPDQLRTQATPHSSLSPQCLSTIFRVLKAVHFLSSAEIGQEMVVRILGINWVTCVCYFFFSPLFVWKVFFIN